ncbi:hypothetical protein [Acetoanaerobium noterae]|uniref:hypothetical protein n=1 Tax=Acetoanaerobium noterae TaxID=745369 RepID=UPI003221925A
MLVTEMIDTIEKKYKHKIIDFTPKEIKKFQKMPFAQTYDVSDFNSIDFVTFRNTLVKILENKNVNHPTAIRIITAMYSEANTTETRISHS